MRASINAHIFETGTIRIHCKCCTRLVELRAIHVQCNAGSASRDEARHVHGEVGRRFVLLLSHSAALSNSSAIRIPCATKAGPPTLLSVFATRNFILEPGRHVQDPVRVDVNIALTIPRQATWCWRDHSKMELPKQIVVIIHPTLPCGDLDESTRLVDSVHRERLSLLRGKVVLRSMTKPIGKRVTSNASHTAPGSSPASPLPSVSSPPHSQVVVRRTLPQST